MFNWCLLCLTPLFLLFYPTSSLHTIPGFFAHAFPSLFGYDQGVTGGLLDLPSFTKYFPDIDPLAKDISHELSTARSTYQGIAVAAYNLGCFLGAVFTIFIGNPLGRKKTIFYGSIIMTVGALLQCTSYDLPQFIVGRLITGWGNGMNTSTVRKFDCFFPASIERTY